MYKRPSQYVDDLITKSGLPVRKAVERVFIHCFQSFDTFTCTTPEAIGWKIKNSTAVNIYFSSTKKICTGSAAADGVEIFKKRKREKSSY